MNNGDFLLYTKEFPLLKGGHVEAYCKANGYYDSMVTSLDVNLFIDKSEWKVISYSSQANSGESAQKAIDDNESTIWHTQYGTNEPTYPHEIVVDMAQTYKVEAFTYLARKDGSNGRIKEYEIYFSNSPDVWGSPAATGSFANTSEQQVIKIPSKPEARYFKLIAKSEVNGKAWASAAELGIEASAIVSNAVSIVPVDHSTGISIRQTTSTGNVTVFSPANASIKIRDLSGRTLSTYSTDGQLTIPMNFPNGIYLICVDTKEMPNAASFKVIRLK